LKTKEICQKWGELRKYLSPLILTILITIICSLLVLFILFQVKMTKERKASQPCWIRIGADDSNTNFYSKFEKEPSRLPSQGPTKKTAPVMPQKQNLKTVWIAEDFSPEPFQLVGGIHKMNYNLRTCDINSDGKLEIIVGYQNRTLVLDAHGLLKYSLPYCCDFYKDRDGNILTVGCSLNMIYYLRGAKKIRRIRALNPIISVRIFNFSSAKNSKLALLTVEKIDDKEEPNSFIISCYDFDDGLNRWTYQLTVLPFIAATGDINQDERNEIICTTFSPDNSYNGVIALSGSGKLIWQVEFNTRNEISEKNSKVATYTDAAIADLNGDQKVEVAAIFGSEDGSLGRLAVINGKTGKLISQYPRGRFLQRAFTSFGLADIDHDGKTDIVTATRGKTARFYSFRMGTTGLETLATRQYFPLTIREPAIVSTWVGALTDIDNDDQTEILGFIDYELPISTDWTVRSSQFLEPAIVVLDERLREQSYIDLDERCLAIIPSDVVKGVANEMLVLSDRIFLYAIQ
jgi:hypothetical protein